MSWLKKSLKIGVLSFLLGVIALISMYFYISSDLPSVDVLKEVKLQTPMKVFSQDGKLISQFGEKRRIPLKLEQLPQPLIDAFIATEDARFYEHPGIDLIGIFRAISGELTGQNKGGGSTITMQVARNYFELTRERSYLRKLKEIFISLRIEQILTKNEILVLYLNKIPLGHRSFGVGAAAQVYYGKSVDQLTLPQIAILAGLPKAPSTLNPISRPQRAINRRAVVLGRMLTMEFITQAEFEAAKNAPITAKRHGAQITAHAPYVAEMVRKEMVEMYGREEAYTGGYNVYTTIQAANQLAAQEALKENIHDFSERHGYYGPERYLWKETLIELDGITTRDDSSALDADEIANVLNRKPVYGTLQPAVVTSIDEQSAYVQLKSGKYELLDWSAMNWARPFIRDSKQGPAPKQTADIFEPGALIWLRTDKQGNLRLSQLPQVSSALVSLSPNNGAIKAIVGGYSFYMSQYNRATQAKRQVGSNIKPFVYSAAIEKGYTLASLINDAPIYKWDESQGTAWKPKNSPEVYDGPIRMRKALAQSKNVVAVRLIQDAGIQTVRNHVINFGFSPDDIPAQESLALGSASLTPLELATGIAAFANTGYSISPFIIERIENSLSETIYTANPDTVCKDDCEPSTAQFPLAQRIISQENAFLITEAMKSTIWGGGSWKHKTSWVGTGWRAQDIKRRDMSGKTGTTNDSKDTWFTGFTPDLITTVWTGYDNPGRKLGRTSSFREVLKQQIVGGEAGATAALPAWVTYMKTALADYPELVTDIPKNIVSVRIDLKTGLLANKNDHTSRFEYFLQGTEPTKYVDDGVDPIVFDVDDEGIVQDEEEIFN